MEVMRYISLTIAVVFLFALSFSSGANDRAESTIGMEGWEFNPAQVTVQVGDKVTWLNDDDTTHDLFFIDHSTGLPARDKPLKIRQTEAHSITFSMPGTYDFACKIHFNYDMKGRVVVTEAGK